MQSKRAFTLVELVAVIVILAILLIIVTPAITSVGSNSRITLRDSKIQSLLTASEKYGNEIINEYQECLGTLTSAELKDSCTLKPNRLVSLGYLKEEDIKDPVTEKELEGNVLICYDPARVSVYASFVEDNLYSCKDIAVNSDNTLSLSSAGGVGYVGGKEIVVSIIKSGDFGDFSCESSDEDYANCEVDGSKLRIKMTDDKSKDFGDELYKEMTINAYGDYKDNDGVSRRLTKIYNLKVYPTDIEIVDDGKTCVPVGTSLRLDLKTLNAGVMSVSSSDKDVLEGTAKDGVLYVSSKNKTGLAELTVTEGNGNSSSSVEKTVYKMDVPEDFPENMVINHYADIKIEHGGTGAIKIRTDNPNVLAFSKNGGSTSREIVLLDEDTFRMTATGTGVAKVFIEGENCGSEVREVIVSSLAFKDETKGTIYIGGKSRSVEIEVEKAQGIECTSSNPNAATCEVHATTMEIKPGLVPADGVILTVGSPAVGYAYYKLQVLKTTIDVVNSSSKKVTNVCREKGSTYNSDQLFVRGTNLGKTEMLELEDWYLAEASVAEDGPERNITIFPRSVEQAIPPYVLGVNTGRTKVEIKEHNGNQTASFYYNIYSLNLNKSSTRMKVDETFEFEVEASGTGELSVSSSNPNVATAEVLNPSTFNWTANAINKRRIRITATGTGGATINIRGASCGVETFSVQVEGKSLSLRLVPGTYTTSLGAEIVSCETEGILRTCEVEFPPIYTSDEFQIVGYSKTKDSTTATYRPGDRITLSLFNNGTTYYGNSMDLRGPVCSIAEPITHIKKGETANLTMDCIDTGSGIKGNGVLSRDNFIISDSAIGEIVDVGSPVKGTNGYSYAISLRGKENGLLAISLKANVLVDAFSNGNAETKLDSLLVSEYEAEQYYYIGKNDQKDVLAAIIDNAELGTGSSGTYSLHIYGSGEMLDFMSTSNSLYAPWYSTYRTSITDVIIYSGVSNVGSKILYNSVNLERVTLANSIRSIGESAFANTDISNLIIPGSVKTIGNEAFYGNRNLTNLTIESGIESIGASAFYNHHISSLYIPSTLIAIGERAFGVEPERAILKSLEFASGSNLKTIGNAAFIYHKLTSLSIPRSVTRVGSRAFEQTDISSGTLSSLNIPDDSMLNSIGDDAFAYCALESLVLPSSLENIGSRAFAGLRDGVTTINVGTNVRSIGNNFAYGSRLENITVATGNRYYSSIDGVLYDYDKSTLVKCPDDYHVNYSTLNVPSSVRTLQAGAFDGWLNFEANMRGLVINLPSTIVNMNIADNFIFYATSEININGNSQFVSDNGVLFNRDKSIIYRLPLAYAKTSYSIPNTVSTVADYFSYGNSRVLDVTVPSSVTRVGMNAFASDSKYAFKTINLDSSESLVFDATSFAVMVYPNESITSRSRTINVRNTNLKGRLENTYASVPCGFVVNKVG